MVIHRALVRAGIVLWSADISDSVPRSEWIPLESGRSVPGTFHAEGACFLLVESEEAARRRQARPIAAILGAGWGRAAVGAEARSGLHVSRAIQAACADGGIDPAAVELVVGSADGGSLDGPENEALAGVFGPGRLPALVLPKRILGECFAFTSAAIAAIAALSLGGGRPQGGRPQEGRQYRRALAVASTRRGGACALLLGAIDG